MTVRIRCPNPACQRRLKIPEGITGRLLRCSKCGHRFPAPPPDPEVEGGGSSHSSGTGMGPRQTFRPAETRQGDTSGGPPDGPRRTQTHLVQVGRFLIRERLGNGAFATVYRAHDPQLDRDVALKVPHPSTLESPSRVKRFLNEAKALARMHHPNIVPIYEANSDNGTHYIASAFIQGKTLAEVLDGGPVDFRHAAEIVRQVAEALAYAHKMGIVHRDVKPSNIILDLDGQAHLVDFGLAFCRDGDPQRTQDGAILGTASYIAPELAAGRKGDPQACSDQYGLGVVLYEMLTGKPPFEGLPPVVLFKTLHEEPLVPRERNPQVPRDLERICMKAMAKKAKNRFLDCRELADSLARWLAKPQGLSGSSESLEQDILNGAKPRRLTMLLSIALGGLLLVLLGVLLAVWYLK
jgi:serine/threonine protein kinase